MKKILLLCALLVMVPAIALYAQSQVYVQQLNNVTPGHMPCWVTTGILQDCGTSAGGNATTFGITGTGTPFGINSGPTSASYYSLTMGSTLGVDGTINWTLNGAGTDLPLDFYIDGHKNLSLADTSSVIVAHHSFTGTTPAVSIGSGDCGTSPAIAGNDSVGRVTVGSSTNGGKCTITFAASYINIPICEVQNETSGSRTAFPAPTLSTVVIKAASTFSAADSLVYQCFGYQ